MCQALGTAYGTVDYGELSCRILKKLTYPNCFTASFCTFGRDSSLLIILRDGNTANALGKYLCTPSFANSSRFSRVNVTSFRINLHGRLIFNYPGTSIRHFKIGFKQRLGIFRSRRVRNWIGRSRCRCVVCMGYAGG